MKPSSFETHPIYIAILYLHTAVIVSDTDGFAAALCLLVHLTCLTVVHDLFSRFALASPTHPLTLTKYLCSIHSNKLTAHRVFNHWFIPFHFQN